MNRKQLQKLGVPPDCAKAAIQALSRAAEQGTGMGMKGQRARQMVAAVVGDPRAFETDPIWGEMAREMNVRCANVFHAGDGNLHPLILFDGREPGALERGEALAGRILRMCVEMGGSITGEHGVGVEKRDFLPAMFSADEIDCMDRIRAAFDPFGIANPGKMFPTSEAPALHQHGLHPLEKAGLISRE